MATPGPSNATIRRLSEPQKLDDLIREDRGDDCTACRVMGSAAFVGLGAYTFLSGQHQLRQQEKLILKSGSRFGIQARQSAITVMSVLLVGLGVYRFRN